MLRHRDAGELPEHEGIGKGIGNTSRFVRCVETDGAFADSRLLIPVSASLPCVRSRTTSAPRSCASGRHACTAGTSSAWLK